MRPLTTLTFESPMPASAEALYAWHARPGAFERLAPPWQPVRVLSRSGTIRDGDQVELLLRLAPLVWRRWRAVHHDHVEGRQFGDRQERGPFAAFDHLHRFEPAGQGRSVLRDTLTYRPPLGALGRWLAGARIRRDLERAFAYRHRLTAGDLAAHGLWAGRAPLTVAVCGSRGPLGPALGPYLSTGGHRPLALPGDASPEPAVDAVVHLGGERLADRVEEARRLAAALARQRRPPRTLVLTSTVSVYGERGDEPLTEESAPGTGPQAERALAYEAAAEPARQAGVRVVALRLGLLLAGGGGERGPRRAPGGRGPAERSPGGATWISWIALDDALDVVQRALHDERLSGPVHAVAPEPVPRETFARTLAAVERRPALLRLPRALARALGGAEEPDGPPTGQRALPSRLHALGHEFRFPTLGPALRHVRGRPA